MGHAYAVMFEKSVSNIEVNQVMMHTGDRTSLMKLSVVLDDEGECRLVDEAGEALLSWQVRRGALEKVFFGAVLKPN